MFLNVFFYFVCKVVESRAISRRRIDKNLYSLPFDRLRVGKKRRNKREGFIDRALIKMWASDV